MNRFQKIVMAIIFIAIFIVGAACLGSIIQAYFAKDNFDTLPISNIGAVALFALAGVLFSWSKSLDDDKDAVRIVLLNRCGEDAVVSAIFFILGSIIKYVCIT